MGGSAEMASREKRDCAEKRKRWLRGGLEWRWGGEKIKIAGSRREGLACAISWDFAQVITFSCATLQIDSGELLMTAKQPSTSAPPPLSPPFIDL